MLPCSSRVKAPACAFAAGLSLVAPPASAQSETAPSQSAMVNLIHLLVKQKVITQASADALLKAAAQEAAQARAAKSGAAAAPVPIPTARPEPPPPAPGVVR